MLSLISINEIKRTQKIKETEHFKGDKKVKEALLEPLSAPKEQLCKVTYSNIKYKINPTPKKAPQRIRNVTVHQPTDYVYHSTLGTGGQATVRKCMHKD